MSLPAGALDIVVAGLCIASATAGYLAGRLEEFARGIDDRGGRPG
jgi:hypothetical protein